MGSTILIIIIVLTVCVIIGFFGDQRLKKKEDKKSELKDNKGSNDNIKSEKYKEDENINNVF